MKKTVVCSVFSAGINPFLILLLITAARMSLHRRRRFSTEFKAEAS